uniref:Beta-glucosidase n=1 Tax=Delphinium grandiflorum TaxID=85439 RepID=U6C7K5_DELGR|nr:hypothetical protein [Delphinium grandiflorum]
MESLFFFSIVLLLCCCSSSSSDEDISRNQFPDSFFFGASTSSYQIEGAVHEDGRGLNNWDVFTHIKGNIIDGDDADQTDDHYHRTEEDIELMQSLGINAYRFSISWTRILPKGRFGDVNPEGILFYNKLIDNLVQKGIEPFVTISHHDVPLELEERYGSWLSPLIQDDFAYYADICFRTFGDRVKYWITINEPNLFATNAYMYGTYPPGRCSAEFGNCPSGDSNTEPLIAVHNMILSHAKAANIYKKNYQAKQRGFISIVPNASMYVPLTDSKEDREAANRALAFCAPWILDPLILGKYPSEMRKYLGDQLPKFSPEEKAMLKDSLDFISINHYVTLYAKDCIHSSCDTGGHAVQGFVYTTGEKNGIPIGERTAFYRFFIIPDGIRMAIEYIKARYNNRPLYVLENGICQENEPLELNGELLQDRQRVNYHKAYLAAVNRAIRDGADVRSYFVWSLLDNFEWASGYTYRYGLYYVDYKTLKRTPKLSAKWYSNFLNNESGVYQDAIAMITPEKNDDLSSALKMEV